MTFESVPRMTFDEQLRRAFETLSDRHQDDIRREVQIAVDEASGREIGRRLGARGSPPRTTTRASWTRCSGWAARDRSARRSTRWRAPRRARRPRAAVLTIRGGRAHGWRFIGFGALDEAPPVNLEFDDAGIIATAARDNVVAAGQPSPAFAGLGPDVPSIAVPLALAGEVVGVLYADAESATSRIPSERRRNRDPGAVRRARYRSDDGLQGRAVAHHPDALG